MLRFMKHSFTPINVFGLMTAIMALCCQTAKSQSGTTSGQSITTTGQSITMTGPSCATTGAVYLYTVSGSWDSTTTVRFCITGGTLVDSGGTCAGGTGILSFVRVTWDTGGISSGSVVVTTPTGNDSIAVTIAPPLVVGQIDSAVLNQSLDTVTTPTTLTCSAPSGGGCTVSFQYQWQQSPDNVVWQNISGATAAQLSFSGPLSQTTYYRLVTTNSVSSAFGYSNVATLTIPMQTPQ
jgi:hypothetical protein